MPIRAVLFDLDGTLIDSLDDIAAAANAALARAGCPAHPVAEYRLFVGEGVERLFARSLPAGCDDPATIAACVAHFKQEYARCWNVQTRPYPGITDLLDALAARAVRLAVLSNKPDDFTRDCVRHYFAGWPFPEVVGARPGQPNKPDPTSALAIAARLELAPRAFAYLGDSAVDMQTARNAGMRAIGATWGFRSREELLDAGAEALIDHPDQFLAALDARR